MDLMLNYRTIENRLRDVYKVNPSDNNLINLIKCRAINLTQLHFIISVQSENSFVNASNKDSLAELLYVASDKLVTDPLSLSPTLVLRILEDELYDPEYEFDTQFVEVELNMREWFADYRERKQKSSPEHSVLPELRWSDLPNELFGLVPEN
ncbi:TPA: hypothetical protein N1140_001180 [Salmonella enterica subsp. enterica serovar Muenchen]|nr:hypothetical protein [Salmonella enterica subsp. enterica serovar Muenchen]